MTKRELKTYFKRLLFVLDDKKGTEVEDLVESAIQYGIQDFWGAYPWAFKEKDDTITTTASQETVSLPSDFEGILSVVEHTSTNGGRLTKVGADYYDKSVPYSESLTTGTPAFYKIYYENEDLQWKLALYPTPSSAMTLYIKYHTLTNNSVIPDKYIGGVIAGAGKYIALPGTPQRAEAIKQFYNEIERLKRVDSPDAQHISRIMTEYEGLVSREKKWWEY